MIGSRREDVSAVADDVRQWALLNQQLSYLRANSAFYQQKFAQAGLAGDFRVTSLDDLAQLPFTDKSELRTSLAAAPPLGQHLAAPRSSVMQIQSTSGTTGTPSYLALTADDVATWNELGGRALRAAGLVAGDTVCHCWSMSKGFSGGLPVALMCLAADFCLLPIGAEAGAERLLTVIRDQGPQALLGTPSYLAYLGERAEAVLGRPARELGVRRLVVGAEPGGGLAPVRAHLQRLWNATCCEVLGNSDISPFVWGECLERDGMHFIGQDLVLVELVEPGGSQRVEPVAGATGELIYTALRREASPVLRFRSGDRVEIIGVGCACGRPGYRLRCTGRTDDMLIVRGVNVWPTAVQEVVASFRPRVSGAMRIKKDFAGHSTSRALQVQIEVADELAHSGELADLVGEITDVIKSRLVFTPAIEAVAAGVLEPPGATKIRLVEEWTP